MKNLGKLIDISCILVINFIDFICANIIDVQGHRHFIFSELYVIVEETLWV